MTVFSSESVSRIWPISFANAAASFSTAAVQSGEMVVIGSPETFCARK